MINVLTEMRPIKPTETHKEINFLGNLNAKKALGAVWTMINVNNTIR